MNFKNLFWGVFLFLFLVLSLPRFAKAGESLTLKNTPPEKWLDWVLDLHEKSQTIQNLVLSFLEPYHSQLAQSSHYPIKQTLFGLDNNPYLLDVDLVEIPKETRGTYYDHQAVLSTIDSNKNPERMAKTLWDSKKTGILPGPESSAFVARLNHSNEILNFTSKAEERVVNQDHYYKTNLQFSILTSANLPIRRGVAEIFQDIQKQQTKISASTIEGPADITPTQMIQLNLQAILGPTGYTYLRQDQSDPTTIPKNQRQFCRNPQGNWVEANSREWEESCAPLFDNSDWHGFSYSSIPASYESFLKW